MVYYSLVDINQVLELPINHGITWLVVSAPRKNMKVNGKDDIPYIMENKSHVWNHQPDNLFLDVSFI